MIRTQIQLREQQIQALKALAHVQGVSMAELIRQSIDKLLESQGAVDATEKKRRAIAIAGMFRSDVPDLSTDHDRYLMRHTRDKRLR